MVHQPSRSLHIFQPDKPVSAWLLDETGPADVAELASKMPDIAAEIFCVAAIHAIRIAMEYRQKGKRALSAHALSVAAEYRLNARHFKIQRSGK